MRGQVVSPQHLLLDYLVKMNKHDLENIKFLLSADEATMRDWYSKTTVDDHEYAFEIMQQYHQEMKMKLALLKLSDPTNIDDISLASEELAKYRK